MTRIKPSEVAQAQRFATNGAESMVDESPRTFGCTICTQPAKLIYSGEVGEWMRTHLVCFECAFWQQVIERDAQHADFVAIIDGRHFLIEPDLEPGQSKLLAGMGGARSTIRFSDGRVVVTRNLWGQGVIPARWRGQLPDNAVFG